MNNALTYYRPEEVVQNELYSTQVTELVVTKDEFHAIWPNLAPGKSLINKIGSASGVEFLPNTRIDTVYGDVVMNADGSQVKKPCGVRCIKQGQKMRPDGSMQISSPCTYEFNWEDRAELDFIADEESNKGKYKTPLARKKHVLELKKFASQRASTGAELMVIRELTGMPTGFKEAELKAGGWVMKFSQICKSKAHQEAEAKARIDNIRNGGAIASGINETAGLLTGETVDVGADFDNYFDRPTKPAENPVQPPPEEQNPVLTPRQEFDAMLAKVSQAAKDHYGPLAEQQNYSLEFLQWAIGDMKVNCPEVQ